MMSEMLVEAFFFSIAVFPSVFAAHDDRGNCFSPRLRARSKDFFASGAGQVLSLGSWSPSLSTFSTMDQPVTLRMRTFGPARLTECHALIESRGASNSMCVCDNYRLKPAACRMLLLNEEKYQGS